jgi:hypothetical protein
MQLIRYDLGSSGFAGKDYFTVETRGRRGIVPSVEFKPETRNPAHETLLRPPCLRVSHTEAWRSIILDDWA